MGDMRGKWIRTKEQKEKQRINRLCVKCHREFDIKNNNYKLFGRNE